MSIIQSLARLKLYNKNSIAVSQRERIKLALSWLFVGIPATWGVAQVATKSVALLR